jgi:hypothetical protein
VPDVAENGRNGEDRPPFPIFKRETIDPTDFRRVLISIHPTENE